MGTTADKVAALTLLLQESAVSNLRSLDELLRWVSKRSGARAVAGQVCTASTNLTMLVMLRCSVTDANSLGDWHADLGAAVQCLPAHLGG